MKPGTYIDEYGRDRRLPRITSLRILEAVLLHNPANKKVALMNFELILKYFGVLTSVAITLEAASAAIAAGAPATTPPIAATLEGKHGTLSLVWNPTK